MITIKDVAKLAGVSTATVSRVLRENYSVKKETTIKVLEAVKALNYEPNILGRYLRTNETKTVFVVIPDISDFFSNVLRGIEVVAKENGYQVLLGNTQFIQEREYEYLKLLQQNKTDGMILLTSQTNKDQINELADQYPVVLACDYWEGSKVPMVSIDNISSARKATEYLIRQGHKRIAHITGRLNIINSRDRLTGYKQAVEEYQLYDPLLIQIGEGDFSYESGFQLAQKLLALELPPDAIFAANDEMAIGAVKAIKKNSLKVPDDIAVIGFNDIHIASVFEPALTTISQPMYKIGETSMKMLLKLMNQEPLLKRQLLLEDKLVVRETTK
ncbi:LacI family DNA-binding transcriptional regulator [Paenibacillus frigoriresistens]|uniref:LacI family DNA-binding transcriptional regulator n=1 Tax=Paenibacillus alginolyticus TaxID=59839 RepID=UPI0015653868|nr:LacI family DNA-binding transcriptional regulator [Paenibacillus frigoriresistens]NRF90388.1 LacI family DNA-binding transcriptional regulator [Paenibacillus frigoriresistens]